MTIILFVGLLIMSVLFFGLSHWFGKEWQRRNTAENALWAMLKEEGTPLDIMNWYLDLYPDGTRVNQYGDKFEKT